MPPFTVSIESYPPINTYHVSVLACAECHAVSVCVWIWHDRGADSSYPTLSTHGLFCSLSVCPCHHLIVSFKLWCLWFIIFAFADWISDWCALIMTGFSARAGFPLLTISAIFHDGHLIASFTFRPYLLLLSMGIHQGFHRSSNTNQQTYAFQFRQFFAFDIIPERIS